MEATTLQSPVAAQLLVSISDLSKLNDIKKAISMLKGVTKVQKQRQKTKPRLYDPETGEYLNDETMQLIEDVRSGKDKGTTYESFEEFKKAMAPTPTSSAKARNGSSRFPLEQTKSRVSESHDVRIN